MHLSCINSHFAVGKWRTGVNLCMHLSFNLSNCNSEISPGMLDIQLEILESVAVLNDETVALVTRYILHCIDAGEP